MENFNHYCLDRDFYGSSESVKELNALISKLDRCFRKDCDNFAETCYLVFKVKQLFENYYFYNIKKELYTFDTIMLGFGISKSESSRLLCCYEKFCCLSESNYDLAKCSIIEEFKGFSKSKLFELLQVDNKRIIEDLKNDVLRYDFSVKQIRQYVKNINALEEQKERLIEDESDEPDSFIEEDIPLAFNPDNEYDFAYFKEKNKAQLLNISWELYKLHQKSKKEKKNEKYK